MTESAPPGNQPVSIMYRLKLKTNSAHERLERLPYFKALADHRLSLECYVGQLRALAIVHGVMESELAACRDERVAAVWHDGLRKLPLLEKDLDFFKPRVQADFPVIVETALTITGGIRLRQVENPVSLLGYLYVFEGSTLGNGMHRPDISRTFHLNELEGCRYYASYGDHLAVKWQAFSENMNTALKDPSIYDDIQAAALEAFGGLEILYNALYPLDTGAKTVHVTRINPEAGNHPIPADEREIAAALRASERGWHEFPYYRHRYGERGRRFSDSDTCWLATLATFDPEDIRRQIAWIGRVLAARGMPRIMLERTLGYLHEELCLSLPDQASSYGHLPTMVQMLREQRLHRIPEKDFLELSAEFDAMAGPEMAGRYNHTGELLLSAVSDEKNGIDGAVSAIREWLTDPARFSAPWIDAVKLILQKAKQLAETPPGGLTP